MNHLRENGLVTVSDSWDSIIHRRDMSFSLYLFSVEPKSSKTKYRSEEKQTLEYNEFLARRHGLTAEIDRFEMLSSTAAPLAA